MSLFLSLTEPFRARSVSPRLIRDTGISTNFPSSGEFLSISVFAVWRVEDMSTSPPFLGREWMWSRKSSPSLWNSSTTTLFPLSRSFLSILRKAL